MSPTLIKILTAIGIVAIIAALVLIIYNQQQIKNQQAAIQTSMVEQQQLVDGIVRSQNKYATKEDVANFAKEHDVNLQAIQNNLDKLKAQVAAINVFVTNSNGQNAINVPTTNTGPVNPKPPQPIVVPCPNGGTVTCPDTDIFGYMAKQQNLELNEDFGTLKLPIGNVGFSAWQKDPWDIHIAAREYSVATVVGTDENQRQYFYNKFSVKVNDKQYDLPIKTATTKQEVPAPTFSWWNPRLLMGVDGGVNINHVQGEFSPSINIGIMSYGQYKTTPDFSILEVGLGYASVNKTAQLVITPVSYNIGKNLFAPVMNNTYLGPSVSVNADGSFAAGVGLRVGF